MTDLRLSPRFVDEAWIVEFDWTPALGGATITGEPTAVAIGAFTVDQVTTVGNVTTFRVSGGASDNTARIALLAALTDGNDPGFNILAPIRAR